MQRNTLVIKQIYEADIKPFKNSYGSEGANAIFVEVASQKSLSYLQLKKENYL